MVRKNSVSFNSKDIITYQSVGKLVLQLMRQEYDALVLASPETPPPWTAETFTQAAIEKLIGENLLRPTTDYMLAPEVKDSCHQAALAVTRDANLTPSDVVIPEAEHLKAIEAYLKKVQEEKKVTREERLKGKARTLSAEELAKYAPVQLSDKNAKAFMKEVDSRMKRKH